MNWKDWAILGAGVVAAPFTGGASLTGAGAIVGARNSNAAAKDAAAQQQAGTSQANAALAPYQQIGAQAQHTLGGLMGLGGSPLPAPGEGFDRAATARTIADKVKGVASTWLNEDDGRTLSDLRAQTLGGLAEPRAAQARTQSSYQGDAVQMRGPNGQIYMVPRARMQEAQASGGQVI